MILRLLLCGMSGNDLSEEAIDRGRRQQSLCHRFELSRGGGANTTRSARYSAGWMSVSSADSKRASLNGGSASRSSSGANSGRFLNNCNSAS
jgi:hypothetical protein